MIIIIITVIIIIRLRSDYVSLIRSEALLIQVIYYPVIYNSYKGENERCKI